jgi:DNA primase
MARYTADSKERVRQAVDMADLVSTRTELRRSGANELQGLCPFHDERTPSFGVNPVEKVYYCFGCQAAGDAFTFVQETEGVDFKGALELLADRFGVELETESEDPRDAERRRQRERLMELLDRTATFYERHLWESEEAAPARAYLLERGLTEEILKEFHVGYSPSAWDRVLLASRRGGFSESDLYAVGLAQRSEKSGQPYDRFRGRIMFPLADGRGRVLGFGARAMRDNQRPKYLNTAEGDLYHKGRQLFAAHLARAHAAKAGSVIVCEGYTDVIALHQAGLRNAVGIMGTALTEEQVTELGRMASRLQLALDADSAGQEAMLRAARVAAGRRLELRVVALPTGSDPADLVRERGADAVRALVEASVPFVRFRVERILDRGESGSAEGRDRMLDELRPLFRDLPASAMREELARLVADRLSLSEALVDSLLARGASGRGDAERPGGSRPAGGGAGGGRSGQGGGEANGSGAASPGGGQQAARPPIDRRERSERTFLALCIALPEEGAVALGALDVEEYFTSPLARRAATHLLAHPDSPTEGVSEDDAELVSLMAELAVRAGEPATVEMLELERLQLELARLEREMAGARSSGRGDVAKLATRRAQLKVSMDRAVERAMEGGG